MKFQGMTERPDKSVLIATAAYWMLMLFMIPIVLIYFTYGFHEEDAILGWVEIVYHVVNLIAVSYIFREHLSDCWLSVQLHTKKVLLTALVGVVAAVLLSEMVSFVGQFLLPVPEVAYNAAPLVELELFLFPKMLAQSQPLLGTLVIVSSSVTVACLLYATGFSPACCRRPWLGYVVVIGMLILHRNFFYYTVGTAELAVSMFLMQLPIHLIACATYHYTDSIWTPIFMLAALNLLGCVGII